MRKLSSARSVTFALATCLVAAPLLAENAPAPARAPAKPPITSIDGYLKAGQAELKRLEADKPNNRKARNVIIFIGDGMGVSTITAGRIFEGQQLGLDGESYVGEMDRLPHTALVKTYSHDGGQGICHGHRLHRDDYPRNAGLHLCTHRAARLGSG